MSVNAFEADVPKSSDTDRNEHLGKPIGREKLYAARER